MKCPLQALRIVASSLYLVNPFRLINKRTICSFRLAFPSVPMKSSCRPSSTRWMGVSSAERKALQEMGKAHVIFVNNLPANLENYTKDSLLGVKLTAVRKGILKAGQIVEWIKCSLCTHDDLSPIFGTHRKERTDCTKLCSCSLRSPRPHPRITQAFFFFF